MRLYLDVCCLNRPFDDQGIDRNRLEAEAVMVIISRVQKRQHALVTSEAIDREVDACPDTEKSELIRQISRLAGEHVIIAAKEIVRWQELVALGFRSLDALHLACAESAKCNLFLTTDDKLLKRSRSHSNSLKVRVLNPLSFVTEVQS